MATTLSFTATILLSYALILALPSSPSNLFTDVIYPNFTASHFHFIKSAGAFLASPNGTFQASISSPSSRKSSFYLSIIHVGSNTTVWSANSDSPISSTGPLNLTANGITLYHNNGSLTWSTPPLRSAVTALKLLENGNLVLLDRYDAVLWQSFDHPTDTILTGQSLRVGTMLASAISDSNLSTGDYRFFITNNDAVFRWKDQHYWSLSTDSQAFKDSNADVSYMGINGSGLYLFSDDGTVVWQVILRLPELGMAKLDSKGQFSIFSFSDGEKKLEFVTPYDDCRLPLICGPLGFCTNISVCTCPSGFHHMNDSGCFPADGSDLPYSACNSNSSLGYLGLGYGIKYSIDRLLWQTVNSLLACQDLCSKNCSCLGFFYTNSSSSCHFLRGELGSLYATSDDGTTSGYIKTLGLLSPPNANSAYRNSRRDFPILALILIPCVSAFLLAILVGFVWWRRLRNSKTPVVKLGRQNSSFKDPISIPGLPVKFKYEELETATDHFTTLIGSGGFGAVYKGTLPDKTLVAVKKINNAGVQGKKEFYTEIAIIGKIRHANLVKLRGFHAEGGQRFLVLEYMNSGSLDRSLFGEGPVLEWQQRMDIAIGVARGLDYLHRGCEHKIIHLDIKPENILLHDYSQVKISDFGLSKLMSSEISSVYTTMRGTRGYLAPEWLTHSAINDKIDVYSYGMVLLEIVRGKRNCSFERQNSNGRSSSSACSSFYFPLFALEMHQQRQYLELVDPRLEGHVIDEDVEKLVRIALCCLHKEPNLRPCMADVVAMLEGRRPLSNPRVESLNFFRLYGRQSAELEMIEDDVSLHPIAAASSASPAMGPSPLFYISSQQLSEPR
ncbi:G-type lectin S-receptor-like serine/threonine-protein kinase At5g35370 [Magnolia sinica]|uniref:G-type lectin S-receptor-like serine/threonine-protein kinase At5g35370 n=1 Tax=Magnolia sinica TaxID=86752 RepID=UPI00265A8A6D|nr:G-type lectin S-receptor-like serine/threonine-protein kinase At5g35370 [Magnolia sinica]